MQDPEILFQQHLHLNKWKDPDDHAAALLGLWQGCLWVAEGRCRHENVGGYLVTTMYRFVREDREKLNASHAPLDGHDAAVDRPVDGSDVRPHWAEGKGLTTLELAICDALISGIEKQEIGKRLNRSPSWVTIQIKGIGVKLS